MKHASQYLMTAALAIALAGPAAGQSTTTNPKDEAAPDPAASGPASGAGFIVEQKDDQELAAGLIGMSVTNARGDSYGTVSDLILDKDRKVVGMVLAVGGFLGIGSKPVALPLDQIKLVTQDGKRRAVISLGQQELSDAPTFKTLDAAKAEPSAN